MGEEADVSGIYAEIQAVARSDKQVRPHPWGDHVRTGRGHRGGVQAPAPRGLLQGQFLGQDAIERASDNASDGSWSYRRSDGWWRWNIVL